MVPAPLAGHARAMPQAAPRLQAPGDIVLLPELFSDGQKSTLLPLAPFPPWPLPHVPVFAGQSSLGCVMGQVASSAYPGFLIF